MATRKINKSDIKTLSDSEFKELARVKVDPFFFSTFIYVIHPIMGKVKFLLYPFQKSVLWSFLNNRFNIILKFRQAGITELIAMYCLWLAMYHPHKNIQIISIKDRVAKRVLRRIKFMYRNLPAHLRVPVVNGRGDDIGTAEEMEFSNGSTITSIPTTEEAGRSEAASLLVIDEAAIVRWASTIWASAFPTLSTGGSAIVNSTPYGTGNWFHNLWVNACAKGNQFTPVRLKWQMHPERDWNWYYNMKAALGDRRTAQEIDGDFLTSGFNVFNLTDIKAIEDELADYEIIEQQYEGNLKIFRWPNVTDICYIGGDVATGRSKDYSAFSVMNRKGEELACFKGKIDTNSYAKLLMEMGYKFNQALLAPESNDIGIAVTNKIQEEGYPYLYYSTTILKEKGKKKPITQKIPGWYTTKKNRPLIIDGLVEDIAYERVIIKDPFFVQEAYTFIYDSQNKPIALGKKNAKESGDELGDDDGSYNDDAILAKCITNYVRKTPYKSILILPK